MPSRPGIAIVDESPARAKTLEEGLRPGYCNVMRCGDPLRCSSIEVDAASIQASLDACVPAYIVDGLKKERLKPILHL